VENLQKPVGQPPVNNEEKETIMSEQTVLNLSAAQQNMLEVWQQHTMAEFVNRDVEAALATMTDDAYVLNVPALTGGYGKAGVRDFYANHFIGQVPPDMEAITISQTVGEDQLVIEGVVTLTHSLELDWMLPGIAPTGKRLQLASLAIIRFRDGKIASEHLYWDQASVLVQLGLLAAGKLPVTGAEAAQTLLDPGLLKR
jgi:carboxymethylenebutenolidase